MSEALRIVYARLKEVDAIWMWGIWQLCADLTGEPTYHRPYVWFGPILVFW